MTHTISEQLLAKCSEYITRHFGLHFPKKRWRDLNRGLVRAARDLGFPEAESYIHRLVTAQLTKEETSALVGQLTIGETYFFREKKCFEALQTHIFPALIDSRRGREQRLRIWCAGCSTGEEPYTVAILLHRMLADLAKWNITILATDINPASLRKGAHGEYGDWSFRDTPAWLKGKYFTTNSDGRRVISESIKKMVTFAPLNLAQDPYPALANNTNAMDVIFCRNVLMYFAPEQIKGAIGKFRHSLVDGGWLIVSPCETSHDLYSGFSAVQLNNTIFYRKDDHEAKSPPAPLLQRGEKAAPPFEAAIKQSSSFTKGDLGGFAGIAPNNIIPDTPPVSLLEEALLAYHRGDYAEAEAKLAGVTANIPPGEAVPAFAEAAALLTQIHANQGNLTLALEWSEKAVAADRLNPRPYYLQATIFQEKGADDAAIVSLKKALYLDQEFILAHFALANLTLRQGKKKEAARHLKNSAALLHGYADDDILPGSEGMSARRLAEIIAAMREGLK